MDTSNVATRRRLREAQKAQEAANNLRLVAERNFCARNQRLSDDIRKVIARRPKGDAGKYYLRHMCDSRDPRLAAAAQAVRDGLVPDPATHPMPTDRDIDVDEAKMALFEVPGAQEAADRLELLTERGFLERVPLYKRLLHEEGIHVPTTQHITDVCRLREMRKRSEKISYQQRRIIGSGKDETPEGHQRIVKLGDEQRLLRIDIMIREKTLHRMLRVESEATF
jgi:hypothetical protein